MSPTLEKLREDLLSLPSEQRQSLIASVTEGPDYHGGFSVTLHPAW